MTHCLGWVRIPKASGKQEEGGWGWREADTVSSCQQRILHLTLEPQDLGSFGDRQCFKWKHSWHSTICSGFASCEVGLTEIVQDLLSLTSQPIGKI